MKLDDIWQDHQAKLLFFIKSRTHNSCEAEDLLHQVFLKAKTKSKSVRDPKKLVSWLYQVTRNAVVDYQRLHKKTVPLPEEVPQPKKEENAWELISRCVKPFILELPQIYRINSPGHHPGPRLPRHLRVS